MNSVKEKSKEGVETVIQYTASAARWLGGIMTGNSAVRREGQRRSGIADRDSINRYQLGDMVESKQKGA